MSPRSFCSLVSARRGVRRRAWTPRPPSSRCSISQTTPSHDFAQVVRRDVGRHADGDAGRTVDQEIGKRRRQDRRLGGRFVEVGDVVDGVLVEIGHHRLGERLEPRFGVAIGRGRIAVDRTEVALAVDQGVAHVEVLRQTDERVVRRHVAVRVVVADDFADDLRALAVRAVRRQAHLAHRVQHAAVRGLQPVAHVRQRAPDDHAHRVIEVRAPHLVFDVYGDSLFSGHGSDRAGGGRWGGRAGRFLPQPALTRPPAAPARCQGF